MGKQMLYLMLGYPGAGKTTTATLIHKITGAIHLSSDAIRMELFPQSTHTQAEHDAVYTTLNQRTEKLLLEGKDVIYDANLNRYQHREEKYAMCKRTGAKSVLIWVQTPKGLARNRTIARGDHHLVPAKETPESMFDRIAGVIEDPGDNEPFIAFNGIDVNQETVTQLLHHIKSHEA